MLRVLACFLLGLVLSQSAHIRAQSADRTTSTITNKDVLVMHAAGLSDDIIIEKIKTSTCDFDTNASVLVQLKTAGVSESVALAMMRCPSETRAPTPRSS